MQKVFNNSMIAHVWAQQNQAFGRTPNTNIYFDGKAIFSYGSHFPMGVFIKGKASEKAVLLNSDSYSVTTSQHQSKVRNAVDHYMRFYADTETLKLVISQSHCDYFKKNLIAHAAKDINNTVITQARVAAARRNASLKESDIGKAVSVFNSYRDLLAFYGFKLPAKTIKQVETLQSDMQAVLAGYTKQLKAEAAKRAKAEKERAARVALATEAAILTFKRGENLSYIEENYLRDHKTVYMRIEGENVRTSHGAYFPVDDGAKAFKLLVAAKYSGKEINFKEGLAGREAPKLGNFSIDLITSNGDVKAGCHFVEWQNIEPLAKQLNLL